MAWWRKGWTRVLGSLFALVACSSGSSPSTTVALPSASTTRPAGFGGTLPAVATTAPAVLGTTAPLVTSGSTTDEAALRARVLEYDRAFREELLHMPNPNYDRLRAFQIPSMRATVTFSGMSADAVAEVTYHLNTPDTYRLHIQQLDLISDSKARVAVCVLDNIVEMGPGYDGMPSTEDDTLLNAELGADTYVDIWSSDGGTWLVDHRESVGAQTGDKCVAS